MNVCFMSAIVPMAEFGYMPPSAKERWKPIGLGEVGAQHALAHAAVAEARRTDAVPRKMPCRGTASAVPKPRERSAGAAGGVVLEVGRWC